MNYNAIKRTDQETRDQFLKQELGEEKIRIIEKYGLQCNPELNWEKSMDGYPTQIYFSHKFAKKNSALRILFKIYRMCYAKVKYFDAHWNNYIPCIYDWKEGFKETDLFNMEFIKHKESGLIIDMRSFEKITDINEFRAMCTYLEKFEKK